MSKVGRKDRRADMLFTFIYRIHQLPIGPPLDATAVPTGIERALVDSLLPGKPFIHKWCKWIIIGGDSRVVVGTTPYTYGVSARGNVIHAHYLPCWVLMPYITCILVIFLHFEEIYPAMTRV